MNNPHDGVRRRTLLAVLSIAVILLVSISLFYYGTKSFSGPLQSATSERSGNTTSSPTTTETRTVPSSASTTLSNSTESSVPASVLESEESAGFLNCTGQENAFLNDGAVYSQIGYPEVEGDPDNRISPLSPAFVYFIEPSNESFQDVPLGDLKVPTISACHALGDAITALGIGTSAYALARVTVSDGEVNTGSGVADPGWTFYFVQTYHGYWLDDSYAVFPASANVDAITGNVYPTLGNITMMPPSTPNFTLTVNSTEALRIVRHTTVMKTGGPATVSNGTLNSIDLWVATMSVGPYPSPQPVNGSTPVGQLRLLWIIVTSAPNYVGYFVVDAVTGQVLEAEADSTLPCGGASDCGTSTTRAFNAWSSPYYNSASGIQVALESCTVNGTALGLNGVYTVEVPNVIVASPGSSGSIGLNLTGLGNGNYEVTPSASPLPSGVSIAFSNSSVSLQGGVTANDTMLISVSADAPEGTYIVFLDGTGYGPTGLGGWFVLSVWDGQGQWPILPMLSIPPFE